MVPRGDNTTRFDAGLKVWLAAPKVRVTFRPSQGTLRTRGLGSCATTFFSQPVKLHGKSPDLGVEFSYEGILVIPLLLAGVFNDPGKPFEEFPAPLGQERVMYLIESCQFTSSPMIRKN